MNTAGSDQPISDPDTQNLENFEVFPKHVGVWQGNWIRFDADGKEIERFTGVVTKKMALLNSV